MTRDLERQWVTFMTLIWIQVPAVWSGEGYLGCLSLSFLDTMRRTTLNPTEPLGELIQGNVGASIQLFGGTNRHRLGTT